MQQISIQCKSESDQAQSHGDKSLLFSSILLLCTQDQYIPIYVLWLFLILRTINRISEAHDKLELEQRNEYLKFKAIKKISKTQKIKRAEAEAVYEQMVAQELTRKAEETRIAEEKAAEEARIAEEKASVNTRLLEEIRDLLKNK